MARHINNAGLKSRSARLRLKGDKNSPPEPRRQARYWLEARQARRRLMDRANSISAKRPTRRRSSAKPTISLTLTASASSISNRLSSRRAPGRSLDEKERLAALGPAITVKAAIGEYVDARGATGRDAFVKLRNILVSPLAGLELAALTVDGLQQWRASLLERMGEASARRVVADRGRASTSPLSATA